MGSWGWGEWNFFKEELKYFVSWGWMEQNRYMYFQSWGWEKRSPYTFRLTRLREMKPTYLWCKLPEEGSKYFVAWEWGEQTRYDFLSHEADGNVAHKLLGGLVSWGKRNQHIFGVNWLREVLIKIFSVVRLRGIKHITWFFESWRWGKRSPFPFRLTKPRETKYTYFWCKLAEGSIQIFRVWGWGEGH